MRNFYTGAVWKDRSEEELRALVDQDVAILFVPEEVYDQHFEIFSKLIYSTPK